MLQTQYPRGFQAFLCLNLPTRFPEEPEKLAICKALGADEVINYETDALKDAVRSLTGGQGVDVVCDPVGGKFTEPALRCMVWKGRYCVIGFTSGSIPTIATNLPLLKCCSIIGVARGSNALRDPTEYMENLSQIINWIAEGKLIPKIGATYPFSKVVCAMSDVKDRKVHGKAVISFSAIH